MTSDHTSKNFDAELNAIRTLIIRMGGLVESQLLRAVRALYDGDMESLQQVIAADNLVNELEVEIERDCGVIITRRQPTAVDLRELIAISKISTELERIGDAAKKIARIGMRLAGTNPLYKIRYSELDRAVALAAEVLTQVLDAFARRDAEQVQNVLAREPQLLSEQQAILRHLIAMMTDDPRLISTSLDLLFIVKAFEQVASHACGIAGCLSYQMTGEHKLRDSEPASMIDAASFH